MAENTSKKRTQRFLVMLSVLPFIGSTLFGFVAMFANSSNLPKKDAVKIIETKSKNSVLQDKERGYQKVLAREPDNQIALEGLVQVRLEMNNLQGVIESMEKLVKLNPNLPQYKALLSAVKQQAGKSGKVTNSSDRTVPSAKAGAKK